VCIHLAQPGIIGSSVICLVLHSCGLAEKSASTIE
jgi:hypothetical protein